MMNPPPEPESESLPELLQANWHPDRVLVLFADLAESAEVEHVQLRSRGSQGMLDRRATLDEARQAFEAGQALAIQIRYRFDREAWCDTIMPQADNVKIIRCRP